MKILIVEDEFSTRKLLQLLLEPYGQCFSAGNGQEAIEAVEQSIIENTPYDLVCMDIMMPVVDGVTAVQKIREIESQNNITGLAGVKIIMITGKELPEHIFKAFRAGCEAYIVKPIHKNELYKHLEKLGFKITSNV